MKSTTAMFYGVACSMLLVVTSSALPWKRGFDGDKGVNLCLMACAMCFDSNGTVGGLIITSH